MQELHTRHIGAAESAGRARAGRSLYCALVAQLRPRLLEHIRPGGACSSSPARRTAPRRCIGPRCGVHPATEHATSEEDTFKIAMCQRSSKNVRPPE